MGQSKVAENNVAADTRRASSTYVPTLQRTAGQPAPIAANGGLSYMSFDRDGDGGTRKALEDALALIAEGEGQRVADMVRNAPPGAPIESWFFHTACIDPTAPANGGRRCTSASGITARAPCRAACRSSNTTNDCFLQTRPAA